MTGAASWQERRGRIECYFDQTAADVWARLTSDAPVSRIRATVRAGRAAMRATLLDWLPSDLSGRRVLDAGCGTGLFAVEAARRGADVLAVDLSPKLLALAAERMPSDLNGRLQFAACDMRDASLGHFDHIVAMDCLIHYPPVQAADLLGEWAERCARSLLFTFAPHTLLLGLMHAAGRLFPRSERAPAIEPVAVRRMAQLVETSLPGAGWRRAREQRIARGFYISEAMELVRP